jgi:hypothetical protein
MPRDGARPGGRRGGWQKGTPNKCTRAVSGTLKALGCDPIEGMAQLAMDEGADRSLRFQAFKELAQYIHPKRKAIEISGENDKPTQTSGVLVVPLEAVSERRQREHAVLELAE